jgi:hypothetical protein
LKKNSSKRRKVGKSNAKSRRKVAGKKLKKPALSSADIRLDGESSRSTIDIIRYKVVINGEKMTLDVHLLNQRFVECLASVKHLKKWEAIPEETRNEVKRRVKLYYAGE